MQSRSLRKLPTTGSVGKRRRFRWARLFLILGLIGAGVYVFLPRYFNMTATGLVEGDLVPVAPIFRAQIDRNLVACDDFVRRGQPLATVSNFLLEQQSAQELQKMQDNLQLARISQVEGLSQAEIDLETSRAKLAASVFEAKRQRIVYESYDRTFKAGAVGRATVDTARADSDSAAALADSFRSAVSAAQERINRLKAANVSKIDALEAEADQVNRFGKSLHAQTLRAPVDGHIVNCVARPQAIVDAGTPIYNIFGTNRAFVLAFYDPSIVKDVHVGAKAVVEITGGSDKLVGTVAAVYPTLSRLPDSLTKYFWQHVQWAEYRPVKITFQSLPQHLRDELVYNGQATISISQHRSLFSPSGIHLALP